MPTKSRKKSSKKSSKKMAKRSAQVELDPATVLDFEAHLRKGLIASGAVLMSSTEIPRLRAGATVQLDSDAIARVAELLRDGLVSSAAVLATEFPETTMQPTRKASKSKKTSTRKGRPSKKR